MSIESGFPCRRPPSPAEEPTQRYEAADIVGACFQSGLVMGHYRGKRLAHGQNYAKARPPSHHLRVRIRRLRKRDRLDHGGHAAQRTEMERCVSGRGVPSQRTFELAASEYEIHSRDLDRLRPDAEDDRDTAGTQPLEGLGDGLATGSRYQNDFSAAERLQSLGGVGSRVVDVVVGAELLRKFRRVPATGNRRDLETHMPGILHAEMTQAADTDHSDKITGLCRCVLQSAERREPRAQQRGRIDRRQGVWDRHKAAGLCDHHFGIAAVIMNAGIFLVPAVHEIAAATELAIAARAAEKPDPNALTDGPAMNTGTKRIDPPDDLMAWDARPFDRKQSFHCAGIRVADPTRLDADPHLTGSRSLQCLFRQLQPTWADRVHRAIG